MAVIKYIHFTHDICITFKRLGLKSYILVEQKVYAELININTIQKCKENKIIIFTRLSSVQLQTVLYVQRKLEK